MGRTFFSISEDIVTEKFEIMCLFLQSMKGLALKNLKSWPPAVKQFNELMAAGRKPNSLDVQTEVLASVHMLPD